MKKILFSLMAIALVVGLVGAGAFAMFSDVEESTDNTFTAGTIDIAVDAENPWESSYEVKLDSVTLLKPCETGHIKFTVTNVGDNPLNLWKHIKNISYDTGILEYPVSSPVCSSEPEYVAEGGLTSWVAIDDIGTRIVYDLVAKIGEDPTQEILASEELMVGPGIECFYIYLGNLLPGETMTVEQSYHLLQSAGNEYQGDVMTFDINLVALQKGKLIAEYDSTAVELTGHGLP